MKLLYASERPPFPFFLGGAARSTHYLLTMLAQEFNMEVMAVGSRRFDGRIWLASDIQDRCTLNVSDAEDDGDTLKVSCGYSITLLENFYDQLPALIEHEAPDVVWTQLDGFARIALMASMLGRDTVAFMRDAEDKPATLRQVAGTGCALFCNSEFMARRVLLLTGRRAGVIYPPLESHFGVDGDTAGYITMINPHRVKGVEIFFSVAQEFPSERFLLVESWKMDEVALAALRLKLASAPNVTFMHRVANIAEVYQRTRLLLVPSLWEEAFGRVAIEAQSCGIPVIASRRGGLPEAVGDGGLCVIDYANVPAWVAAIRSVLDDPKLYQELSTHARLHSGCEQFTTRFAAKKFVELCGDRSLFGISARRGLARWLDLLRGAHKKIRLR